MKFFSKKEEGPEALTLEKLVEKKIISKEEMLLIKKERAVKEWETETGNVAAARSHHKKI